MDDPLLVPDYGVLWKPWLGLMLETFDDLGFYELLTKLPVPAVY